MRLHTTTSWDEMFLRVMQSWADTALWIEPPTPMDPDTCRAEGACDRNPFVAHAEAADPTVAEWPHWMRCELQYLLWCLKLAVQDQVRNRPHYDATVFRYYHGSGTIKPQERSREVREAIDAMHLNNEVFFIWLYDKLSDLGDWPKKVYDRLYTLSD